MPIVTVKNQDEHGGTKLFWAAGHNRFAEAQQLIKSGKEMGVLEILIEKICKLSLSKQL